jgi:hypothetical protein
MLKEGTEPGAPYAAMMLTPGHGVRLQSNFDTDVAGRLEAAPVWLRLTRDDDVVTGFESEDGVGWREVGSVELAGLGRTVAAGLFVTSPRTQDVDRSFGSVGVDETPTLGHLLTKVKSPTTTGKIERWQRDPLGTSFWRPGPRLGRDLGGSAWMGVTGRACAGASAGRPEAPGPPRRGRASGRGCASRVQDDLDAVVLPVPEHLVAVDRVLQRQPVGGQVEHPQRVVVGAD